MDKKIIELARKFRKKSTKAENIFWQAVRNRKIMGKKFNRQYPLEFIYLNMKRHFIADFYCHSSKLIVEIDGGIHEKQKEYDRHRTEIINQLGIKIIRFNNEKVENELDAVLEELKEQLTTHPQTPSLEKRGSCSPSL
ncbi:MAG: endonuclease domain-containing protein [Candidatus Cloacimonadota bacterium]|nr:endonuclease domain-containing protein [Candidatus Cloacimonadota bacterium]